MPGVTRAGGPILPPARKPESLPPPEPVLPTAAELALMTEDGDFDIVEDILAAPEKGPELAVQQYTAALAEQKYATIIPVGPSWEELTATETGYLLRHDGQLYVAVPVNAASIIEQTLAR